VLNAGDGQTLSVVFTPADPQAFRSASATVNINVDRAPLSVTANNASRVYGNANPTFTGVITGIKNGDNITAT
jgi:hypothetical protein